MALPTDATPCCFILTSDRAEALPFYRDVLALPVLGEDPYAVTLDLGSGAILRLTTLPGHAASAHTVLGWTVADIRSALAELVAAGVTPQVYEGMGQDEHGVWSAGGAHIVWFKDPDGNVLSLTQLDQA